MPLTVPDPIAAMIVWLLADADIALAVGTRVYGVELPKEETPGQPQKSIVVKPGAGPMVRMGCARLGARVMEFWAYGGSPGEAGALSLLVYQKLKFELDRVDINNTLIHDAVPVSQGVALRDPDTNWPFQMQSFQITVAETATL